MDPDLLAAVGLRPDDDGPRLALAASLEPGLEPGEDARAGFIRGQLRAARLPDDDPERQALERRCALLLERHRAAWVAPLSRLGVTDTGFARGLVESIELSVEAWLAHAGRLFVLTPIRTVRLTGVSRALLPRLLDDRHLLRLETLDLSRAHLEDRDMPLLAACPALSGLSGLVLSENDVACAGLETLARSATLARLERLDLARNCVEDDGVAALGAPSALPVLASLDLTETLGDGNVIGPRGLLALTRGRSFVHLGLGGNPLGNAGVEALVESEGAERLVSLELARAALGPSAALAIAASARLGGLRRLELSTREIGVSGARALLSSPWLPAGLRLRLWGGSRVLPAECVDSLRARFASVDLG